MSRSDPHRRRDFSGLITELEAAEAEGRPVDGAADISMEDGGRLLGIAVRLYVRGAEGLGDRIDSVPQLGLTATEAVVAASALLKDQDLTPFDLWLWFQRVMRDARTSNSFQSHMADLRTNEVFKQ